MVVDTHHHFWNPRRIPQPWMTGDHAAIARVFEPSDLEPLLGECGVGSTVLVQSSASDEDTDYMFEVAGTVDWVGAIIGWCRLDDPLAARRRLDELQDRRKLRGIRHLIHQEPDPHWILRSTVGEGLRLLEERGLLLELPAVYPNHLDDVPTLAARYPGLSIVVDHLGKPPLGTDEMARWDELLPAAAAWPNVHAKISGLNTATEVLATGQPPTCSPRSTWLSTPSDRDDSCAGATGRSPFSTARTRVCGRRRSSPSTTPAPIPSGSWS